MYHSLGNSMSVREHSVIGVFDLDNTSCSAHTRSFLRRAEESGQIITVSEDLPKSFVLTREYGLDHVYLTQFASRQMAKRFEE